MAALPPRVFTTSPPPLSPLQHFLSTFLPHARTPWLPPSPASRWEVLHFQKATKIYLHSLLPLYSLLPKPFYNVPTTFLHPGVKHFSFSSVSSQLGHHPLEHEGSSTGKEMPSLRNKNTKIKKTNQRKKKPNKIKKTPKSQPPNSKQTNKKN